MNSQEVIDIAGNFIQKNTTQIQKSLISPKHIEDPVIIYTYDGSSKYDKLDRRSGANYAIAYAVQTALDQIIIYDNETGKNTFQSKILLLGRFGFDGDRLARTGIFEYVNKGSKVRSVKYPKLDITFMTAHASKGLGYDNVIVINGKNETYGFPSKIEDNPVLSLVVKEDKSMQYAEERRLFYVAMTRTKNRVYFIAPEKNPSEFLLEIKREYKNVCLRGKWSEENIMIQNRKKCPICGFPLQLKYKTSYGLRLYICTNEPEICSFMTNDIAGKKISIMKCPDCQDGYLIVKHTENGGYFLGCSNYLDNRKGCNTTISMRQYYKKMGYEWPDQDKSESTDDNVSVKYIASSKKEESVEIEKRKNWEEVILLKNNSDSSSVDRYPEYKGHNIFKIVETVLHALVHISDKYYFGVSILADVLRGKTSDKVKKHKLNLVNEYGSLYFFSREEVLAVIYWLIEKKYILQDKDKGRYPVLHITNMGLTYKEHLTPGNIKTLVKDLNSDKKLWRENNHGKTDTENSG
ncbi:MAG: hypothetical protein HDR26_07765 [Lachnospiraceae bacterium]|nr:hypothetical protein [Lachnospiraceae bacterium]